MSFCLDGVAFQGVAIIRRRFFCAILLPFFWISGRAQNTSCDGDISWIADGYCDVTNNNIECNYDGGDCCECTCSIDRLYPCGIDGFTCLDPSVANVTTECPNRTSSAPACSTDHDVQEWLVDDTASARSLAEAVNCTGGNFNVTWEGRVVIDHTIYVAEGTTVHLTGADEESEVDGGGSIRLFTLDNASLHMNDITLSNGYAVFGGAIAAMESSVTLNGQITIYGCVASDHDAGALYLDRSSLVALSGQTTFSGNSAHSYGGALVALEGSSVFLGGISLFFNNTALYGGAVNVRGNSIISWAAETSFANNSGSFGGAISVEESSNVSWSAETSFANNSGSFGGAISVEESSNVSWSAETSFENNSGSLGGALYVVSDSKVLCAARTSFSSNMASLSGGALHIDARSYVYSSAVTYFSGNSGKSAGAIYAADGSNVSWLSETRFVNNNAFQGYGGAIYLKDGCSVRWSGISSFIDNTATFAGGALFVYSNSSVNWSAETSFYNNSGYFGGAVCVIVGSTISWTAETSFINNAGEKGGVIYINRGNVWWDTISSFIDNTANLTGGALYVYGDSSVYWAAESSFVNNRADFGGALYIESGFNVSWSAETFFLSNIANKMGGALCLFGGSTASWTAETSFENNSASEFGGALVVVNGSHVSWSTEETPATSNETTGGAGIDVAETKFINNNAGGGGALAVSSNSSVSWSTETSLIKNSGDIGGAVLVEGGSNVSWTAQALFIANIARAGSGGAMYADDGSSIWWSGVSSFIDNTANWSGGALFLYNHSTVSWSAETYYINNSADYGGAVYVEYGSNVLWTAETSLINNNAFGGSGGALAVQAGSSVRWVAVSSFSDNLATLAGGGILVYNNSKVFWTAETFFNNNIADIHGGAIAVGNVSSASWEKPTTFFNNSALSYWGGAIVVLEDSNISWWATTSFVSNMAGALGGWLASLFGSSVTMEGDTFFFDNVAVADGGAAYIYQSDDQGQSLLTILNIVVFQQNICGANGGGMALIGSIFTALARANMSFSDNIAGIAGGAVYLSSVVFGPVFAGTRFVSNSAEMGGGVYTTGSGIAVKPNILGAPEPQDPLTFKACEFIENKAATRGGALDSGAGLDLIVNSSFVGNKAGTGGALRLAGEASLDGCNFTENISDNEKGTAVYNEGLVSKISSCSFINNVFHCEPNYFFKFDELDVLFDTLCKDCDVPCEDCHFEGKEPMCSEELDRSSSPGGNITLELLFIEKGFWRVSNTSTIIRACYNEDACEGGVTGAQDYCRKGYEGPYCSVCSDGYTPALGHSCNKCPDDNADGVAFIAVLSVVALVAFIIILTYMLSGKEHWCANGGFLAGRVKIIIVVWQILTQFCDVANFAFPGIYQEFLDAVELLNFDVSWIISTGCIAEINFHDRLLISTLGPIIGMVILGATFVIAIYKQHDSEEVRRKHFSMVLLLTFLVYSSVSTTVFTMFVCDDLDDDTSYLRADYRIDCNSSKHEALQIYAGFMVALYAFGVPAFYAYLLFKNRRKLQEDDREDNDGVTSFADLWQPYKQNRYFYEIVEYCRRIMLTGVVVFVYPDSAAQIAVALMMAIVFFIVFEALAPYNTGLDLWASRTGHAIVVGSMFLALLHKVDVSEEQAKSQAAFESLLVAVNVIMVLIGFFEILIGILAWTIETVYQAFEASFSQSKDGKDQNVLEEDPTPVGIPQGD